MSGARQTSQRIFVTGATGVIGRRAVPRLVAAGHRVTAVGRNQKTLSTLASAGADVATIDLFDRAAVRNAVAAHDVVINLATHMPSSTLKMMLPWEWRENDRVRREGAAILSEAASDAGVSRFIQESFAPIYDDGGDQWIDERWAVRPARYNRTTLDAERAAARFTANGGAGVVLRFAGFYGPDAFLHDMLNMARRGWCPLPGRANAYWSSVSHDDAATAVVAALDVPAGIYNVCDDEPLTRRAWANALASAARAGTPRLMPAWLTAIGGTTMELLARSQRMTNAKLKAACGWAPAMRSAREGLAAAAAALAAA